MPENIPKHKIELSDYDYQRDIENRLLMSELTVFDVDVLREIVDGPLKASVKQIAKHFDVSEKALLPVLKKLSKTGLFSHHGDVLTVNKEMRRYYESQLLKFDDDFEPDMEFLQGLLSKVPIHALPNWYAIPPMTNNIFTSIVKNYLDTPKIYQGYLSHLKLPKPTMQKIMKDVLHAPDYKVPAKSLIKKYNLSREEFEEYMLFLEYSLVCCLGYNRDGDVWAEVVMPFHEWGTYLRFLRDSLPKTIENATSIKSAHAEDFGFIVDVSRLIEVIQDYNVKVPKNKKPPKEFINALPNLGPDIDVTTYIEDILNILLELEMIEIKQNQFSILHNAQQWLQKSSNEQAMTIYRLTTSKQRQEHSKDLREIERSLSRVSKLGWIYFDDFLAGMTTTIRNSTPVTLQNKGKRWKYVLPQYSEEESQFIEQTLVGPLFQAGLIATGKNHGRLCFNVTAFGRTTFGET